MDTQTIIIVSCFGSALLILFILCLVLLFQVCSLRRIISNMQNTGRIRVQKLKIDERDKNHAFHNATIAPNEELSRRGYSMYVSNHDVERGLERYSSSQAVPGGLVSELTKELESRQERQSMAPPFLLQSIEENKRRSRVISNDEQTARKSDTNFNFIY